MRPFTLRGMLVGGLILFVSVVAWAQPPAIRLAPAESKLEQEFSGIVGARELPDGRLLVSDQREGKLVVVDFKAKTANQAGKVGKGPGEYENPDKLYAVGGDSTLMVERRTQRWHLFKGIELVRTLAPDDPTIVAVRRFVNGADGLGNVIRAAAFADEKSAAGRAISAGSAPESSYVLRANRRSGTVDTLGWIKNAKTEISTQTNARGAITAVSVMRVPYSPAEELAMFEDGWLAITRIDPYRVDWVSPAGKASKGARLPWTGTKITEPDVAFWLVRGTGKEPTEQTHELANGWMPKVPDAVPAVLVGGTMAMGDGQLLVQHPPTVAQPNARYDVIDRSGKIRGTIAMAKGEAILLVGAKWAYVLRTDDDGLQFVSRHPWSSSPLKAP